MILVSTVDPGDDRTVKITGINYEADFYNTTASRHTAAVSPTDSAMALIKEDSICQADAVTF